MAEYEIIRALLSQATASGGKSTVLQPLGLLTGFLIFGLVAAASQGAPEKVLLLFAVLLCFSVLAYLISYSYFAIKAPDSLRSERFTLSKMALEKNLIGDDKFGLLEIGETDKPNSAVVALPALSEEERK